MRLGGTGRVARLMRMPVADVARAVGGTVVGPDGSADTAVDGAAIDSRNLVGRPLFVPIIAERDGHDFLPAAVEGGAGAYLTSRPASDLGVPAIEVVDT